MTYEQLKANYAAAYRIIMRDYFFAVGDAGNPSGAEY